MSGIAFTRYLLSKKEKKQLESRIRSSIKRDIHLNFRKKAIEIIKTRLGFNVYFIDDFPLLIERGELLFPSIIAGFLSYIELPKVAVDDGAVPHILNGADVMAPGIVSITESFSVGELVYVVNLKGEVIAVGRAVMTDSEIFSLKKGRSIKNLHYYGDKIWNTYIKEVDLNGLRREIERRLKQSNSF